MSFDEAREDVLANEQLDSGTEQDDSQLSDCPEEVSQKTCEIVAGEEAGEERDEEIEVVGEEEIEAVKKDQ